MFKNEIPKTLEECIELDSTAIHLWEWSERLITWGTVIFVFIFIIGLIMAASGSAQEVETGYYYTYTKTEFNFGLFLGVFITWVLYALIEFCCYNALSLLLSALAKIVQNTKMSAAVSLYHAGNQEVKSEEQSQ